MTALKAMIAGGVDIVEIGLPYSDPTMDGPTIQVAVDAALARGTTIRDVLGIVAKVAATGAPTLVMSYWNPIERTGVRRFASEFATAGGAGVITPDLIPDEAEEWIAATDAEGLDRVFLVAPPPPMLAWRTRPGTAGVSCTPPRRWVSPAPGPGSAAGPRSWSCGPGP